MYWAYAGYLSAYYIGAALVAARELPHHPRPLLGALAYFVLLPLLLVALTGEPVLLATAAEREQVRRLFQQGRMSRGRAFRGGFVIGVGALVIAVGLWFSLPLLVDLEWWLLVAAGAPVLLGACAVPGWLVGLAREAAQGGA
jgi:hypothetical protein